ncbi:MAG: arsenate reductase (thioredoxin) [Nitrospirota bacterium]
MVKVMFLCTGNSCRSQMAEGFARRYGGGDLEVYSAGLTPVGVNENAAKVMAELGIDISGQTSKAIDRELLNRMDIIVTLCGHAESLCPATPPEIKRLHWPVDDPVRTRGSEEKVLAEFRRARDEIMGKVVEFIRRIKNASF